MRTTQQFSVTLPIEMANLVKTKVAGGTLFVLGAAKKLLLKK